MIGDRCLIGMGAVILDGAEIGEGCIVASGAVVLQGTRIPPRTLVAGIPAVKKKEVEAGALQEIERSAIEYAALASNYLDEPC
jgi:carbonic anhydrase/acetyltransferase-like protein (isoleucine patch superfamily)